jgi:hypothetical protein
LKKVLIAENDYEGKRLVNSNLVRYAAFGTAICWILSLIFFGMEFGVSLIFGTLANIASALAVLLLLVLVLFSHQLFKPHFKAASAIVTTIAVVGIFIDLLGYLRLILSPVAFSEVIIQLYVGYGLIGIWLIGIALMNVQTQILPAGLTWTGGLAGIGLVTFMLVTLLSPDSFLFGGQPTDFGSPLSLIGSLAAAIAYLAFPVWAILMGRAVRRDAPLAI